MKKTIKLGLISAVASAMLVGCGGRSSDNGGGTSGGGTPGGGTGGGTTGSVTLDLDVSELTALGTTAALTDYVVIQDVTDNSTKKVFDGAGKSEKIKNVDTGDVAPIGSESEKTGGKDINKPEE